MKEFMYLFRGGDARRAQESPEAWQAHMQKWMTWMENLKNEGTLVGGLPLNQEGKVVEKAGEVITDGPFTEGKEVVGGYLIVKAKDLDHAVEISKQCPIFEHEGSTEVREIMSM
ncbi:YciI family protein [Fulvivirga ulvae]|uniref:YciI family protein n=1 Tax=Fulvivirga ulvae TaxID=2904245 RepID=UPI001F22E623|nr:YciI family protein [Fulvivirga ulvae]UII34328.1 YciI family protein [Fulvivirga ulvae]